MENLKKTESKPMDFQLDTFTCIVEIINNTPANWNAVIGGACKFIYQDDNGNDIGEFTDYHDNLNISTGHSLYFQSNQPNSCVKRVEVIVRVATPLLPNQQTIPVTQSTDKDHCLKNPQWQLVPQGQQLRSNLLKNEISNLTLKYME